MGNNKAIFYDYINRKIDSLSDSELENKYKIKIDTIRRTAKDYLKRYANDEEKHLYNKRILINNCKGSIIILKKAYEVFSSNDWFPDKNNEFFINNDLSYDTLRKYAITYAINILDVSMDELKNIIYNCKCRKFEMNSLAYSERFIKDYINSNLSRKQFCNNRAITLSTFEYHLKKIKNNTNLYQKCINKVYSTNKYVDEEIIKSANEFVYYVLNGINDNGITRPFDILDYISLINYDIKDIVKGVNELYNKRIINLDVYRTIKKYVSTIGYNGCANEFDGSSLVIFNNFELVKELQEYKELNCKRDKNGFPIKGTGKVISYEEKLKVLTYLKNNNIVVNGKTFDAGCYRIANGYNLDNKLGEKKYEKII